MTDETVDAESLSSENELMDAHEIMDSLCILDDRSSLGDRLRDLIIQSVGGRARGCLRTETGRKLAAWWLENNKHDEQTPCALCADALALLGKAPTKPPNDTETQAGAGTLSNLLLINAMREKAGLEPLCVHADIETS